MEKSEEKSNRTMKVTIRFTPAEYKGLHAQFAATTKRKFSDYLRCVLLNKKITVYTRDKSLDELVLELIRLRAELSAIGNNFNQAVKRLNAMTEFIELRAWVVLNEKHKQAFFEKVAHINQIITQISTRW